MAENEEKKGLFKKATEAFSSKDEKETIAELEAELEASKKAINSLMSQTSDAKREGNEALKEAEEKIAKLEAQLEILQAKDRERKLEDRKTFMEERQAKLEAMKKPAIITVHTVESNNQTLSHVALKYYKHATPPYWQYLLEHNKEVLGGSEKNIRMGMKLEIPELPEELKD